MPPQKPLAQTSLPQFSRWTYLAFISCGAIAYTLMCLFAIGTALGSRGEAKPEWFDGYILITIPGMIGFPLSSLFWGGLMGLIIAFLFHGIQKGYRALQRSDAPTANILHYVKSPARWWPYGVFVPLCAIGFQVCHVGERIAPLWYFMTKSLGSFDLMVMSMIASPVFSFLLGGFMGLVMIQIWQRVQNRRRSGNSKPF